MQRQNTQNIFKSEGQPSYFFLTLWWSENGGINNKEEQRIRKLRNKAHEQPREADFWSASSSRFCRYACREGSVVTLARPHRRVFIFSFILQVFLGHPLCARGYVRVGRWNSGLDSSLLGRGLPFKFRATASSSLRQHLCVYSPVLPSSLPPPGETAPHCSMLHLCSGLNSILPPQTSGSISFLVSWLAICIFYEAIPRIAPSLPCSPPSRYVTADFIPYAVLNSLPYPLFFHGSLLCLWYIISQPFNKSSLYSAIPLSNSLNCLFS